MKESDTASATKGIGTATSVYLDALRVFAAVWVLLFHASFDRFAGAWIRPVSGELGTPGVVVFFVLSGYIIAWVASTKEKDPKTYFLNRLSRLWSVALPALALTLVADWAGRSIDSSVYPNWYGTDHKAYRLLMSGAFVNQIWFLDVQPLTNGPFWSLCYDWWYYCVFGFGFVVGGLGGWALAAASALIAGPKALMLMPVWLMGAAAYRMGRKQFSQSVAWAMFAAPIGLVFVLALEHRYEFAKLLPPQWGYSRPVISCLLFGALVTANLMAMPSLEPALKKMSITIGGRVRAIAGMTLSLYLFHYPLLHFFAAVLHLRPTSPPWMSLALIASTVSACWFLSRITEARKGDFRNAIVAAVRLTTSARISLTKTLRASP